MENVVVLLGRKTKEKHVTCIFVSKGVGERERDDVEIDEDRIYFPWKQIVVLSAYLSRDRADTVFYDKFMNPRCS